MNKLRLFVGIPVDDKTLADMRGLVKELKKAGGDVKWVEPENLHLTLKFLGETSPEKVDLVKKELRCVSENNSIFFMVFSGLGAFPSVKRPKVIKLGVGQGAENLKKIALKMEKRLEKLGFEPEKRNFSPHLTLGRVRSSLNQDSLMGIIERNREFCLQACAVSGFYLIKSTLTPSGPVYEQLEKFILS